MKRRRNKIQLAAGMLVLLVLACNYVVPENAPTATPILAMTTIVEPTLPPPGNLPRDENAVPRVPIEQAYIALNSGAAVFVDVRSVDAYQAKHIKGAVSIPLADIEANPNGLTLKKDQWIITYCT